MVAMCKNFNKEYHTCRKCEQYILDNLHINVVVMCPVRPYFGNCLGAELEEV